MSALFADGFRTTLAHWTPAGSVVLEVQDATGAPSGLNEPNARAYLTIGYDIEHEVRKVTGLTGNLFSCEALEREWEADTPVTLALCSRFLVDAMTHHREWTQLVSGTLTNGATEAGTVDLGRLFYLYRVTASAPCRLRLYATAAHRAADAARPVGIRPLGDHGVIADLLFTSGAGLDVRCAGVPRGANLETVPMPAIPYALTNLSGGPAALTIALLAQRME